MDLKCVVCHTINRRERRFCKQCGTSLTNKCVDCGFNNLVGESYCGGCGHAVGLLVSPPSSPELIETRGQEFQVRALATERRQITVLFCDLVGSTALSTRLDPEDMREVIRAYQALCHALIVRYDGYVARFVGDGIMTYFGYPLAHEDDAERAVRAALGIVQTIPELYTTLPEGDPADLAVRIGIATGLVVAGDLIGSGASEQNAVVGSTPHLAARLQANACPNAVVVSDTTRRLLGKAFDFKDLDHHRLPGIDEPIHMWEVSDFRSARTRFTAANPNTLTPIVGRDSEIEHLSRCWDKAKSGRGQVILIRGEFGIGKSRITTEFHRRVRAEQPTRIIYQCSPHHTNSPLYPFISHLERAEQYIRNSLDIDIRRGFTAPLPKPAERVWKAREIFNWLLFDSSPGRSTKRMGLGQRKANTVASLIDLYKELSPEETVFAMFEDAHWIDPTSLDFLDSIIECLDRARILLVVTFRPDFRIPAHWHQNEHVTELVLQKLLDQQGRCIVDLIAGDNYLPRDVRNQIIEKTDGIPLFIEELTKAIVASNETDGYAHGFALKTFDTSDYVPSTLHDSLMARLDQLGAAKEFAQIGAAIGREFSYELLAAVTEAPENELQAALRRLVDSDLISRHGKGLQQCFVFKHALVQHTAYASVLRAKRRKLHARIAEVLDAGANPPREAEPDVIAHHYTEAGIRDRAALFWADAAHRALKRSAYVEMINHSRRGLSLLEQFPENTRRHQIELRLQILLGAGYRATNGFACHDTELAFIRAEQLSASVGDNAQRIDSLRGLYTCYYVRGEIKTAFSLGHRMMELATSTGDSCSIALGHYMLGAMSFWRGDFIDAREQLELGAQSCSRGHKKSTILSAQIDIEPTLYAHLSWVLWIVGYPDQAIRTSERAIETARQLSQPFTVALTLFWACITRICCGQPHLTQQLTERMMALSIEYDFGYLRAVVGVVQGHALIMTGNPKLGLAQVEHGLAKINAMEAGIGLPWVLSIAAAAHLRSGKIDEGILAIDRAFQRLTQNQERHWEAELHRLRGELYLAAQKGYGQAEKSIRTALSIATRQGARSLKLRAAVSLVRLHQRRDQRVEARTLLAGILSEYEEGFDTTDVTHARRVLQALCQETYEQGREDVALPAKTGAEHKPAGF